MKLKEFKKLVNKQHKRCGNVDVQFLDGKGNKMEIESIMHFNSAEDVTFILKNAKS